MKAALYARVSTLDKGQNPEVQLAEMRRYCAARGWEVYRQYFDAGISGAVESRPQLDILMNDARKRYFDIVLVWAFDRFGRSVKHLLSALEEFRSLGIQFRSHSEEIDTTSPTGKLYFTLIAAFAEFERHMIMQRVRAGIGRCQDELKTKGSFVSKKGKLVTKLGRPRAVIDFDKLATVRALLPSNRAVAQEMGVSERTIRRALQERGKNMFSDESVSD